MLLMYLAGSVFNYYTTPKVMLLLPVTFITLFSIFPETPIYLLRNDKIKEAERALKFLRGLQTRDALSGDVNTEIQKMIRKVNDDAAKARCSNLSGLRKFCELSQLF